MFFFLVTLIVTYQTARCLTEHHNLDIHRHENLISFSRHACFSLLHYRYRLCSWIVLLYGELFALLSVNSWWNGYTNNKYNMRHEIFYVLLGSLFSTVCYSRPKYYITYNEVQFSQVISENFVDLTSVRFPHADKEYCSGLCECNRALSFKFFSGFRSRRPVLSVHQQHCLCLGHCRHLWGKWVQHVKVALSGVHTFPDYTCGRGTRVSLGTRVPGVHIFRVYVCSS
jgi:hypothetical protein